MDWIDVAFSVGTSVTVSFAVTVYFFTWLRSDIKKLKQELKADIRENRDLIIKYIANGRS